MIIRSDVVYSPQYIEEKEKRRAKPPISRADVSMPQHRECKNYPKKKRKTHRQMTIDM